MLEAVSTTGAVRRAEIQHQNEPKESRKIACRPLSCKTQYGRAPNVSQAGDAESSWLEFCLFARIPGGNGNQFFPIAWAMTLRSGSGG